MLNIPGYPFLLSIILILLAILLTHQEVYSEKIKWIVMLVSLFAGGRYLYWRWAYTINREDPLSGAISWIVYGAEIYGFISVVLFYLQIGKPVTHQAKPPKDEDFPRVDIFVTIFDESLDILYKTLVGCTSLDYPPHLLRIYVLDDGYRPGVRAMSNELGCQYLSRPNRKDAKAGNLNYGLAHSSGEFIMVLDCDHIPVRSFLKETLGFFKDEKVALVQTPHYFYNPDTFQRNLRLEREIVNEQDLFFYVIQPGKDRHNASFYAGSGAVFRRTPLEKIGGIQTKTLTEDLHTSMVLHSKGFKSIYLNKILAAGLAPESYRSYLKQRQRWTRGGVQVFLMDNPIWKWGLSFMQRLNYLGSILYFFHGWARLIYLVAPLSYLLLGRAPLTAAVPDLLNFYLPYYLIGLMAFNRVSLGYRSSFWSDMYETVMCFFISWTAFATFFSPKKNTFFVTPKGIQFSETKLDWSMVVPHLIVGLLLVAGLGVGGYKAVYGEINRDAALLSGFWTLYNLIVIIGAIVLAREQLQNRTSSRIFRSIKCEISIGKRVINGMTTDLSETGLSMVSKEDPQLFFPAEEKIRLVHNSPKSQRPAFRLSLPPDARIKLVGELGETTELKGEVIRYDFLPTGEVSIGIRFLQIAGPQRQSLIRQIYCFPGFWQENHRKSAKSFRSLGFMVSSPFRTFIKEKIIRRLSPRLPRKFKCEVKVGDRTFKGETEDISYQGVSLRLSSREILKRNVELLLYNRSIIFRTQGEIVHCSKVSGKGLIYGVRFLSRQDPELALFLSKKF
ncbi:MAG: glycosyltransferase [Nitrospirae bacterium]|nr:glycosyltransferase [Nitrospirota bacterium]MBI3595126.1 glycosyltransferase [Nitrospirota bacterium]